MSVPAMPDPRRMVLRSVAQCMYLHAMDRAEAAAIVFQVVCDVVGMLDQPGHPADPWLEELAMAALQARLATSPATARKLAAAERTTA